MRDGLLKKIARRAARLTPGRSLRLRNQTGVVSFSFDDVPRSACVTGRAVLEDAGYRGTYYVCGGLTDSHKHGQQQHSAQHIQDLSAAGHEIGCQGFAHLSYQTLTLQEMDRDISRNRQFFRDLGLPAAGASFAYPYGTVGPIVKQHLQAKFTSARSVWQGINAGRLDLGLLKAVKLYEESLSRSRLAALIEETARTRGWLILVTHGVREDPGRFDCSPGLLRHAVNECRANRLHVAPVSAVLDASH